MENNSLPDTVSTAIPLSAVTNIESLCLNHSSVVTLEVRYRNDDENEEVIKTYKYVSTYTIDDPYSAHCLAQQSKRVIILNYPDFYYDTLGRHGSRRLVEISRRILEVYPGYPVADREPLVDGGTCAAVQTEPIEQSVSG